MSNINNYAKKELDILRKKTPDAVILEFEKEILDLCEKFGNSGQSGASAPYVAGAIIDALKKLMLFKPICGITGEEEEWDNNSFCGGTRQNKRLPSVFKEKDGKTYYLDAIVWQGPEDFDSFTGTINGVTSRQYIKSFPFEPKTFKIDVLREDWDDEKHNNGEWDRVECGPGPAAYQIKDKKQLEEVFKYYDKYDNK